ncbi:Zn-dependent exopeptidase [Exidia glandulosa HHB12029]|uniref:Peptide hydrolase n=1 Tax=Exidia glandulosa HHB12029 TaxID=1314781 RepID=A0A165JSI2_EXIGL|nr:Zn-dependent exopeptidase [Exidia glandulosa HHB12029]
MRVAVAVAQLLWALTAHSRRVVVLPDEISVTSSLGSCDETAFRGTFVDYSVYQDCELPGSSGYDLDDDMALFHVQAAGVDQRVTGDDWSFANDLATLLAPTPEATNQVVLGQNAASIQLVYSSEFSALVAVHRDHIRSLDARLPPYLSLVAVADSTPRRATSGVSAEEEHLGDVLEELSFNGEVASLLGALSLAQMKKDITWLSGEDAKSPIWSRHSFSDGAQVAADWIQAKFEDSGARCYQMPFLDGFAPNVVCEYSVSPNGNSSAPVYVLGAHYDSRGSWGSTRAPGADDDGSGTTQILAIARAIGAKNVTFRAPVRIVAFAGEEQGLLGSKAYARKLKDEGTPVALMIQADMLAFHLPGEPMQLGLPKYIHAPVASYLVGNVSNLYSPELSVGVTAACCSDHQSFVEQGFPATQVFERNGPIVDPMYHNSGDLVNRTGYDLEQVLAIAKVTYATVLHAAGYDVGA